MTEERPGPVDIEVAFALPGRQSVERMTVAPGATAREAVMKSALPEIFPEIDFVAAPLGNWGAVIDGQAQVSAGDRIEVYRSLTSDPRERRRQQAAAGLTMIDTASDPEA